MKRMGREGKTLPALADWLLQETLFLGGGAVGGLGIS